MKGHLILRQRRGSILLAVAVILAAVGYLIWMRSQPVVEIAAYQGTQLDNPSPDFLLSDHRGKLVALSEFRGKVVLVTFFDSKCVDVCPMIAVYLRQANRMLGVDAERVAFLAVNVNEQANSVADVAAATEHFQLGGLSNWYFLTGSPAELELVWADYFIFADPTPGRQLLHTAGLFLVGKDGRQRWYISTPSVPYGKGEPSRGTNAISGLLVSRIRDLL